MSSGPSRFTWLLIATAALTGAVIWFTVSGSSGVAEKPFLPESATSAPVDDRAVPAAPEAAPAPPGEAAPVVTTPEIPGDPGEPPLVPPLPLQKGELAWEKRIREILSNAAISDADKARLVFDLLPSLPVEGRQTAAEQAVTLVRNDDYRVAQTVVLNPSTYPPALAVLWSDLMERPAAISLPTLLQVARNSAHPYAPYARENMELLVGRDFGTDWNAWESAIRERARTK